MTKIKLLLLFFTLSLFLPSGAMAEISESHVKSVVQIKIEDNYNSTYISSGSGIFIDAYNILTNYHVVENVIVNPKRYSAMVCLTYNIQTEPECIYSASPFGIAGGGSAQYLKELDLALISVNNKITKDGIKNIWNWTFDDIKNDLVLHETINVAVYGYELTSVNIGDTVQTRGYPGEGGKKITYSNGKVAGFQKNTYGDVLKIITSARITPGSSGGAAFDSNGNFIGITSAMYHSNGEFLAGIIIPVSTVNIWLMETQGYRIDKKNQYTTTDEDFEKVIEETLKLLGGQINTEKDSACKIEYGQYSYYTEQGYICGCLVGYEWQNNFCVSKIDKTQLMALPGEELSDKKIYIVKTIDGLIGNKPTRTTATCEELNAILDSSGFCRCADNYGYSETRKLCVKKLTANLALPILPTYVLEKQSETEQPTKPQPTPQPTLKKEVQPQDDSSVTKNVAVEKLQKAKNKPVITNSESATLQSASEDVPITTNQIENLNYKDGNKSAVVVKSAEPEKQSRIDVFVENVGRTIKNIFKKLFKH